MTERPGRGRSRGRIDSAASAGAGAEAWTSAQSGAGVRGDAVAGATSIAAPGGPARLTLESVRFSYGRHPVLDGIDLEISAGERVAILGPNGAGKSTLLRVLAGSIEPRSGRALLDGAPLRELRGAPRARRLAFVPQESRIAFDFSVLEVVLMGRSPHLGLLGIEGERDLEVARRALAFTDALHLEDRPIAGISSGERQRVLLARALAQEPGTILLDEPTAFLDLGQQVRIHRLLEDLNRERGTTIVFVSHDLNLAARHAARLVLMAAGRVFADGSPEAVLTTAALRSAYGVEASIVTDPISGTPAVFVAGPASRTDTSSPDSHERRPR